MTDDELEKMRVFDERVIAYETIDEVPVYENTGKKTIDKDQLIAGVKGGTRIIKTFST